ncbi:RNA polymerase sigma factor [Pseudolysinimonas sp.]|uniref:RNA polymerase sigma factor n=1 Tax=Pseudolysinimonas sp. TaxID=2680009 RepID=UPI003F7FF0AB
MDAHGSVAAVWRTESARIVATLARVVGDFSVAEDLAQDALAEALVAWPRDGVPENPGAWLTAVAKRRAIDGWRRRSRLDERYAAIAHDLSETADDEWKPIPDDVLRLIFTACHPVLAREAQVALTLRVVAGLSSEEIAAAFLVGVPTIQARITRAKKTLSAAGVPFEVPDPSEWQPRLGSVLAVLYSIFTEGYAATTGESWVRDDLAREAIRLARIVAQLVPREPEALGLLALLELQAARLPARTDAAGEPVLLPDQDRRRFDRSAIRRGRAALRAVDALGRGRGAYGLQAAIAEAHAVAPRSDDTDWERIALLYEALGRVAPSPVVELNRAVAVSMAAGPERALAIVDRLVAEGALTSSHLLPAVRGELLARLGRGAEARAELLRAADLAGNATRRRSLLSKALELPAE